MTFPDYAPHPSKGSTAKWKNVVRARGPVGLLIQSVFSMGSLLDKSCKIWSRSEPFLDILNTPFQHVASIFTELATKARTAARSWTKTINRNLSEIYQWVTMQSTKKLNSEDHAMLRTSHSGGGVAKVELHAIGAIDDTVCDYCGHAYCDFEHIVWTCPFFHPIRVSVNAILASIDIRCLPVPVRRGIAPAMK